MRLKAIRLEAHGVALKVVLTYLTLSCIWILLSDKLILYLLPYAPPSDIAWLQTLKGFLFLVVSSAAIYGSALYLTTSLRKHMKRLHEGDELFRMSLDRIPDAFVIYDSDLRLLFVNQLAAQLRGQSRDTLLGKRDEDVLPAEITGRYLPSLKRALETRSIQRGEIVFATKPQETTVLVNYVPVLDESGNVKQILGVGHDVSERIKSEQDLRLREKELRQIIDLLPQFVFAKDSAGKFLLANRSLAEACGTTVEELLGKVDSECWNNAEELARFHADDLQVIRDGAVKHIPEETMTDASGKVRTLQTIKMPFTKAGTDVPAVLGIATDISDRIDSEAALRESELLYRKAITEAGAVPYQRDYRKNSFTFVGEGIEKITGYSASEMTVELWHRITGNTVMRGESEGLTFDDAVQRTRSGGVHRWQSDCELITRFGESRWVSDTSIQLFDDSGAPCGALGILQDITERKWAEQSLQESEKRFRSLVDHAVDALFLLDRSGRLVDVNQQACKNLGYLRQDLLTASIADIDREMSAETIEVVWNDTESGELLTLTRKHRRQDGTELPVEIKFRRVEMGGEPLLLAFARDISERQMVELERSLFAQLGLDLAAAKTPEMVSDAIIRATDIVWKWDAFYLAMRRSGRSRFRMITKVDTVDARRTVFEPSEYEVPEDSVLQRVHDGESLLINRTEAENNALPRFGNISCPSASLLYAPVRMGQKPVAIISVQSYTPGLFQQTDRELLQRMADAAAPALERCRAEKHASAFIQLGERLGAISTTQQAARIIVDVADELLGWDACSVSLYSVPDDLIQPILRMDIVAGKRADVTLGNPDNSPGEIMRRGLQSGSLLILRDSAPETFHSFGDETRPSASIMWVLIRSRNETIGLLSIQSYTRNAYDQDDLETLKALADHCGAALERTRVEMALHDREERYRRAIDEAGAVAYQLDYTTRQFVFIGEGIQRLTGYASNEFSADIMRNSILEVIPRGEAQALDPMDAAQQTRDGRYKEWRADIRLRARDGTERWLSDTSVQLLNESGRPIGSLGILIDITDRKQAEQAIRESEGRYRTAITEADAVPYQLEYETNSFVFIGEGIQKISGHEAATFTTENWKDIIKEVIMQGESEGLSAREASTLARTGVIKRWRADLRILTKRGEMRWLSDTAIQVRDAAGKSVGSLGILQDITDRKRMEQSIRESEERYRRAITEAGGVPYQRIYADTQYFNFIGEGIERITGYSVSEFLRNGWRDMVQETIMLGELAGVSENEAVRRSLAGQTHEWRADIRIRTRSGDFRWLSDTAVQLRGEDGKPIGTLGILQDITKRKEAEAALRDSEERYALATRGANDGLWDWDLRRNRIFYSTRWQSMLGCSDANFSESPHEWLDRVHPEDRERVQMEIEAHVAGRTEHLESEHRIRHSDGSFVWVLCRGLAVRDESGIATRMAGSLTDITDRRLAEERLLHDALHDALTMLPNRTLLMDRLDRALERTKRRTSYRFALIFLDLDRFKNINDSLGHLTGDHVLRTVAARLAMCVRPGDTVARFAGDEFAMLLDDVIDDEDIISVAERVHTSISQPMLLGTHEIITTASMGIALGNASYAKPDELLRDADNALYRAKAKGKARYEVFDISMHAHAVETLALESELRRVIERKQLQLCYQPIISLGSGAIEGFEALIRWDHPERGIIMPDQFIPMAEETGLIVSIGEWVLGKAAVQLVQWQALQDPEDRPFYMNVNLSARQFALGDLDTRLMNAVVSAGADPSHIGLEITESVLIGNPDEAARVLQRLKAHGFRLLLDDFGTGYSSLSYLHRFPIDVVKVDRSFVRLMKSHGREREIVQTILMLAGNLRLAVTAEGVETEEQLSIVRELGCDSVQGFLISQPLAPEMVLDLWVQGARW